MKIILKTIPNKKHRYPTIGDWKIKTWCDTLKLTILASKEIGRDYAFLILIHELIEAFLCHKHGISDESVVTWDLCHPDAAEPGDLFGCPYRLEHNQATSVEKLVAVMLGVSWEAYERKLDLVFKGYR